MTESTGSAGDIPEIVRTGSGRRRRPCRHEYPELPFAGRRQFQEAIMSMGATQDAPGFADLALRPELLQA
ncbi:MAG TPA: hypothetical protein VFT95_23860, partial [Micromonosporaceae bacterium]|nr:hypothetical protein [Micromonosporaceae bacterium]